MSLSSRGKARYTSILLSIGFLLCLAFLPSLLKKSQYNFPLFDSGDQTKLWPMEKRFPVIPSPGIPSAESASHYTLKELAEKRSGGILVNFWATWCPPCLDELPSLEMLNRQLNDKGSAKTRPLLVTISVDAKASDVANLYKTMDFQPSFIVLHDPEGEFSRTLGTTKFPETYWVSTEGKVLYKWIGPQNWLSEKVLGTLSHISSRPSEPATAAEQ